MKRLKSHIIESLLDSEKDIIDRDIPMNGVYVIESDSTAHYVYDINGKEITPIDFNWDIDCIGLIIDDDHSYCISKKLFYTPMFSKFTSHMIHKKTKDCYINVGCSNNDMEILANDMNGYEHTYAIGHEFDDAELCHDIMHFKTDVIDDWYLPSIGELMMIMKHQKIINNVLHAFGCDPLKWELTSSTQCNHRYVWVYCSMSDSVAKLTNFRAHYSRAIAKFDLTKMKLV